MQHQFSPFWHRIGKLGLWRLHGNTLPWSVNRRYLNYGRRYCGAPTGRIWPPRFGAPHLLRRAVSREKALSWSAAISQGIATGALRASEQIPFMVSVPRPIDFLGSDVLNVFDGPLGSFLREGYGCEFRVEWLDCYRTYPGERDASWLWHIDNVPPYLAKVLLYLTDSDATTGATEFLPGANTRSLMSAGYFGVTNSERRADVAEIAQRRKVPYKPLTFSLEAGDAVVFSTNTLHRGGVVSHGYRDVISAVILPARPNWREHLARYGIERVQSAGGFPSDPFLTA